MPVRMGLELVRSAHKQEKRGGENTQQSLVRNRGNQIYGTATTLVCIIVSKCGKYIIILYLLYSFFEPNDTSNGETHTLEEHHML